MQMNSLQSKDAVPGCAVLCCTALCSWQQGHTATFDLAYISKAALSKADLCHAVAS